MTLRIESSKPSIEEYYSLLRQVQNLLLVCKSEIARLRRIRNRCRDTQNIAKLNDKIEDLTKLRMYLENVIRYARKCRRDGYLDEAIQFLKEVLKNV